MDWQVFHLNSRRDESRKDEALKDWWKNAQASEDNVTDMIAKLKTNKVNGKKWADIGA